VQSPAWHIITGEYPPGHGGVADYTHSVARALAAEGDEVHVWAPAVADDLAENAGVRVHPIAGGFGPRGLARLTRQLGAVRGPRRVLVQYVPHAFGMRAMNVPFCAWIAALRDAEVWVMFHEVALPWEPWRHWKRNVGAAVTRAMAGLVAGRADRVFVSVPRWEGMLRPLAPRWRGATWLPIPSNLPLAAAAGASAAALTTRARLPLAGGHAVIGHFGTYGSLIVPALRGALTRLLRADRARVALLVGRGGEALARELDDDPSIAGRVHATGELGLDDIALWLRVCDILVQPYPDGVSARRTSVMAGLALGVPIATNEGPSSESIWRDEALVELASSAEGVVEAAEAILGDVGLARVRAARARNIYEKEFSLERTIRNLRAPFPTRGT
jgi:glycosyltransferase involved in cell wall biosynthesis